MKINRNSISKAIIKTFDIGYVSVIFSILAVALAELTDNLLGRFEKTDSEKESTSMLIIKAIIHIWVIGATIILVRYLLRYIPSPFDGMAGYQHELLIELTDLYLFAYIYLTFQASFEERLNYIYKRIVK